MMAISIRDKRILTGAEVAGLLGEQVFRDARAARWIGPCVVKDNARTPRPCFAMADVLAVEERMRAGEYPGQKKGGMV